ncbi:nuclear transport factor 2 family protein [Marinicella litoralis]|uniref:SnoaL-like protein n=1 Tax=Marinicella litoralis TaxID=644220 RepID=A0A4R6XQU8_9GAMM|nr:nuclear transport factor 2 family protein [Marinicella litoralis]TDR20354.1 SnoaL-like protein [Marinicella litoralis]
MNNDPLKITELYFNLSNQANLNAIELLFHPEATYSSAHTGLYYGIDDIMAMMKKFFDQFSSIHWQINAMKATDQHITETEFTCLTTDHSGVVVERSGVERLVVVDALIRHVEVR